ncbi:hypothetical protein B0T16DRAFT_323524 [Cercophora newfieldiana]|uniref:Uncharacterized protein n=1 Tax=Cercophora newfieldiana TaxID=92897 RepID=A0AA39YHH1_9PEZI|nr:hypothetical protein B0T16DRAFT_323524 [Cercophora newfieldiana]
MRTINLLPFALLALSSPTTPPPPPCTYGAYRCATPPTSIQVCDYYGKWQRDWTCQPGTTCQLLASGGGMIPYCVAGGSNTGGGGGCTTPGKMECMGTAAIRVCNVQGAYEKVGDCPAGTGCRIMYGVPYCM